MKPSTIQVLYLLLAAVTLAFAYMAAGPDATSILFAMMAVGAMGWLAWRAFRRRFSHTRDRTA